MPVAMRSQEDGSGVTVVEKPTVLDVRGAEPVSPVTSTNPEKVIMADESGTSTLKRMPV